LIQHTRLLLPKPSICVSPFDLGRLTTLLLQNTRGNLKARALLLHERLSCGKNGFGVTEFGAAGSRLKRDTDYLWISSLCKIASVSSGMKILVSDPIPHRGKGSGTWP